MQKPNWSNCYRLSVTEKKSGICVTETKKIRELQIINLYQNNFSLQLIEQCSIRTASLPESTTIVDWRHCDFHVVVHACCAVRRPWAHFITVLCPLTT